MAVTSLVEEGAEIVGLEPFPVPPRARRRRVVGVDVWFQVWRTDDATPTEQLRAALVATPCRVVQVRAAGGSDEPHDDRLRARLVARREDAHLTDDAIAEVLGALASIAHWSLVCKLEEFDAVPAFAPVLPGAAID